MASILVTENHMESESREFGFGSNTSTSGSSSSSSSDSSSRSGSPSNSSSISASSKAKRVRNDSEDEDKNSLKAKRPKITDTNNEKDDDQTDHDKLVINNNDFIYWFFINMKDASYEDRLLNIQRKPATKKNSILKYCMSYLLKKDLQLAFLHRNILIVLADWLTPLPNTSLPSIQIRESILKLLSDFPPIDRTYLKHSGIEEAVMYLYKHPEETKENRERAGRLISEWARPIVNSSCANEERKQKDIHQVKTIEKETFKPESSTSRNMKDVPVDFTSSEKKQLGRGDANWVPRARVPQLSNKDYVVRPKSTIQGIVLGTQKHIPNRFERQMKKFLARKRLQASSGRAVKVSIDGRKMAL